MRKFVLGVFSASVASVSVLACSDDPSPPSADTTAADGGGIDSGGGTDSGKPPVDAGSDAPVDAAVATYSIGGTVTGIPASQTLKLKNGVDEITRTADGVYTFPTELEAGDAYDVTVSAAPAGYTCAVANGKGTVASADVANADVTCTKIPGSCREAKAMNAAAVDGVYGIYAGGMAFDVYCDMATDGGGWTKILMYKDAAYTPTTAAAGAIAVAGTPAFAKLSDAQINAIGGAGAVKTYRYMGNQTTKKLFVQTVSMFDDTARAMNLAGAVDACEADTFAECSPTPENSATTDSFAWGTVPNDADRFFTDYSGVAECYPATGANARCFNAGVSTGHVRIDDFSLWVREAANLPAALAHWKLDENTGTTFADASGNGYGATATAGAWVVGKKGSAYSGTAVMDADLPADNTFTIALWVKRDGAGVAFPRIVSFPSDAFELASYANGATVGVYAPTLGWQDTTAALPATYTHITAAAGNGTLRVYEDGVLKATYASIPTIGGKMSFGIRSNGGGETLVGAYDDVRIYDRVLWPAEVDALSKL